MDAAPAAPANNALAPSVAAELIVFDVAVKARR
jgi:hypothetical protein